MKKSTLCALGLSMLAFSANAANLWVIGDATPYGWSTDDATALLSTPENPNLYTGTLYLIADKDFKFMATKDFGGEEYGAAVDAVMTDGTVKLAEGTNDEGYAKLQVKESANYLLKIDTNTLTATITKSSYQNTEIKLASLFLIGDATEGGWSVDNGTPLYQNAEAPYKFSATNIALKEGSFKIATVIKGGGSFDKKYFYFRDATNPDKMVPAQEEDLQWSIQAAENYDINVDINALTISIEKYTTGVDMIGETGEEVYYDLQGIKTDNPDNGLYIRVRNGKATKVLIR